MFRVLIPLVLLTVSASAQDTSLKVTAGSNTYNYVVESPVYFSSTDCSLNVIALSGSQVNTGSVIYRPCNWVLKFDGYYYGPTASDIFFYENDYISDSSLLKNCRRPFGLPLNFSFLELFFQSGSVYLDSNFGSRIGYLNGNVIIEVNTVSRDAVCDNAMDTIPMVNSACGSEDVLFCNGFE